MSVRYRYQCENVFAPLSENEMKSLPDVKTLAFFVACQVDRPDSQSLGEAERWGLIN